MKVIGHGYDEAQWWYNRFISKEEWKRKTAWIVLDVGSLEYEQALKETYADMINAYWSLSRLTKMGTMEYISTQRKVQELWKELMHVENRMKAREDFPEMCNLSFENQTVKEPFVLL
jgi:hypothetical protein